MKRFEVIFDLAGLRRDVQSIDQELQEAAAWTGDAARRTPELLKRRTRLQDNIAFWEGVERKIGDARAMMDLAAEDGFSEGSVRETTDILDEVERTLRGARLRLLLSGEDDEKNVILTIQSGAGGTEAQDWGDILLRMYLRWCATMGFKTDLVSRQDGEEAGLKSATVFVEGGRAFGYLRAENGVHRLIRISPFDANHRRHTSFASVSVLPQVHDEIQVDVRPEDLRIDTYRAGGHGGQNVNKVESAVRITHAPSGIVVQCQNERSQHKNRDIAMKILKARLFDLEKKKRDQKTRDMHDQKGDISFGSQIRTYTLQPYRLVKDHRTGLEKGDVDRVLDGDLEDFIEAFLFDELKRRRRGGVAN